MLRAELDDVRGRLRVAQVNTTRHECMVEALVLERASLVETTAEVIVESHLTIETKEAMLTSVKSVRSALEAQLSEARHSSAELTRRAEHGTQRADSLDAERALLSDQLEASNNAHLLALSSCESQRIKTERTQVISRPKP